MNKIERLYKIETLLSRRQVVGFRNLQEALEGSRATLRRDLDYLRNCIHEPIEWSHDEGYRPAQTTDAAEQPHLTKLWFSSTGIHALLTMQQLLGRLDSSGVLALHVALLQDRLTALLDQARSGPEEAAQLRRRMRIVVMAQRSVESRRVRRVGTGLLQRKCLRIVYRARGTGKATERDVLPRRMVPLAHGAAADWGGWMNDQGFGWQQAHGVSPPWCTMHLRAAMSPWGLQ